MRSAPRLKVLIADDEPLARAKLADMLRGEAELEVVGQCRNGLEVVKAVDELSPDLVLLDIQMPELSGLDVVRAIGVDRMPPTIFVTAFGEFALEAFELHALDYLMKPFDQERLQRALARARKAVGGDARPRYEAQLRGLLRSIGQQAYTQRFLVKRGAEYTFVAAAEVDWMQSADNYVILHAAKRQLMIRETLAGLEEQLDPRTFLRIRASAIVNLERVAVIRPWSSTEFEFVLRDGTTVRSSRRYRDHIRTLIP